MKDRIFDILNRLTEIENISINLIIDSDDLLGELCFIRENITKSGFMNTLEDFTFNVSSELKRSIFYKEDNINKIVNKFNSIRTKIITYIFEKIRQAKKERNKLSIAYFNSKKRKIPGKIKCKYSNYFFRYFTDTDLKELILTVLKELSNFTILDENESNLSKRMCIYYFPKLLTAYLFLEFRSSYLYSLRKNVVGGFAGAINMEKMIDLLRVGRTQSFQDKNLYIHLDSLISVVRNKINNVAFCYKSLSDNDKNYLIDLTINKNLLIKLLNVFNGKDFKYNINSCLNQKRDEYVFYKENFKDFIEDLYNRI